MLTAHEVLAFLLIAECIFAALIVLVVYRRSEAGALVAHSLVLAQTLVVAETAFGVFLLADDRHAGDGAHYMYGSLAVLSLAWPWFHAPGEPRRRLAWFGGATLLAAVLAVRAWMTA
jgi:hypothetical protein